MGKPSAEAHWPNRDDANAIAMEGALHHFTDRVTDRWFSSFTFTVQIGDLPAIVAHLKRAGANPSYVIFSTGDAELAEESGSGPINLQYAIQDDVPGLEWVNIMPRNIADRRKVASYIRKHGHTVKECELNDVLYLRTEDGDLVSLGLSILSDLYGVRPEMELQIFSRWIIWTHGWRAINQRNTITH